MAICHKEDIIIVSNLVTSPAFTGVKIKSEGKPLSRACCATGEGITFLPLSLPEGGCVTMAVTYIKVAQFRTPKTEKYTKSSTEDYQPNRTRKLQIARMQNLYALQKI